MLSNLREKGFNMKICSHIFSLWPEIFRIGVTVYRETKFIEIGVGLLFWEWTITFDCERY